MLIPTHRPPTHPGELLLEDYLKPRGIPQIAFAERLGVPMQRLNGIVRGKRAVTAETALLLARELDTTPELWLNAQMAVDLYHARQKLAAAGKVQKTRRRAAAHV
jgi:addiction module HigA family antidote